MPVIVGVSVASVSELSFSAYCLMAGILSNIFAAARGVFGKQQMSKNKDAAKKVKDISPENYYSIVTTISFLMLMPVSLLFEGKELLHALTHLAGGKAAADFKSGMSNAFLSGSITFHTTYIHTHHSVRPLLEFLIKSTTLNKVLCPK